MVKDRNYDQGRRTYPGYMLHGEFERQRNQLDSMVKGITGVAPTIKAEPKITQRLDSTIKVGKTENFSIEIDRKQKTVLIKEKNIVVICPFKLSIEPDEVEDVIKLLTKSVAILRKYH